MKHKKTLVAIILSIILVFSMFALVACNSRADVGTTAGILADYSLQCIKNIEDMYYRLIGYGEAHSSNNVIEANIWSKKYAVNDDIYTTYGDGVIGIVRLSAESTDDRIICDILFYDSMESAMSASNLEIFVAYTQYENLLVSCQNIDFEDITSSEPNLANSSINAKECSFIENSINSTLHEKKSLDLIFLSTKLYKPNATSNVYFSLLSSPTIGNCNETYTCLSKSLENIEGYYQYPYSYLIDSLNKEFDEGEFTNDSYLDLENSVYCAYTKPRLGFRYNETDRCAIAGYCYDSADIDLIIPDEHDGQPITCIDVHAFENCIGLKSVTIPQSITYFRWDAFGGCTELISINYLGTKKQWKEISKGAGWDDNTGEYIIHCTDGDLDKYGNEI